MIGKTVSIAIVVIAFLLSIPAASHTGFATWLSFAAASVAFAAMSVNILLATRLSFIETAFNGQDKVYHFHKYMGIAALIGAVLHYIVEPVFQGKLLTAGLNNAAKEVAEIAFIPLMILFAFSLVKRLPKVKFEMPYGIWRQSHRLMGVLFIALAFHHYFIKKPYLGTAPSAEYLTYLSIIVIIAFIYTQVRPFFAATSFEVTSVEKTAEATLVTAKKDGRPARIKPGQFAFIHFEKQGLKEPHPFTVSAVSDSGDISFGIKASGDFTQKLKDSLSVGDKLRFSGPHGGFVYNPKVSEQIWLAGGIGITPFRAFAQRYDGQQKVTLVHSVSSKNQALFEGEFQALAAAHENFHYLLHATADAGRLNAETLLSYCGDTSVSELWFCGPVALREAIVKGLKAKDQVPRKVHFEKFAWR